MYGLELEMNGSCWFEWRGVAVLPERWRQPRIRQYTTSRPQQQQQQPPWIQTPSSSPPTMTTPCITTLPPIHFSNHLTNIIIQILCVHEKKFKRENGFHRPYQRHRTFPTISSYVAILSKPIINHGRHGYGNPTLKPLVTVLLLSGTPITFANGSNTRRSPLLATRCPGNTLPP